MQTHSFCVALTAHPDSAASEIRQISVKGELKAESLALCYTLQGDWSDFVFPDSDNPAPAERLWTQSCCELFWREADSAAYREYNFSPSGQWAAYAFSAYRERARNFPLPPLQQNWTGDSEEHILHVEIPVSALPLQLGFAVVLQRASSKIIYYALKHPPGSPDFHHPDNFALYLPCPYLALTVS